MISRRCAAILLLILASRTAAFPERPSPAPSPELGRGVFSRFMAQAEKAWHASDRNEALRCYHAAKQTARAYGLKISSRDEALISYITRHEAGLAGPQPASNRQRAPGCDEAGKPAVAVADPKETGPGEPSLASPKIPASRPRAIPSKSNRTLEPTPQRRVRLSPLTPRLTLDAITLPAPSPSNSSSSKASGEDYNRNTARPLPSPPSDSVKVAPVAPLAKQPATTAEIPAPVLPPLLPTPPPQSGLIPNRTLPSSPQANDGLVPPITLPSVPASTPPPIALPALPSTALPPTEHHTPSPAEDVPTTRPATPVVLSGDPASTVPRVSDPKSDDVITMSRPRGSAATSTQPNAPNPLIATESTSSITAKMVFWMVIGPIVLALLLLGLMTQEMPRPTAFVGMLRRGMRWATWTRDHQTAKTDDSITLTPTAVARQAMATDDPSVPADAPPTTLLPIRIGTTRRGGQQFYVATVVFPGIEPAKVLRRSDGQPFFRSRAAALSSARHVALKIGYEGLQEVQLDSPKRAAA